MWMVLAGIDVDQVLTLAKNGDIKIIQKILNDLRRLQMASCGFNKWHTSCNTDYAVTLAEYLDISIVKDVFEVCEDMLKR